MADGVPLQLVLALALVDDRGPAALALMGVLLGVTVPVVDVLAVMALAGGAAATGGRGALVGVLEAVPMGLLTVGAALRIGELAPRQWALSGYLAAIKLLAVPAAALGLVGLLGIDGDQRAVVLAFAVVPPATASYVLTRAWAATAGSSPRTSPWRRRPRS